MRGSLIEVSHGFTDPADDKKITTTTFVSTAESSHLGGVRQRRERSVVSWSFAQLSLRQEASLLSRQRTLGLGFGLVVKTSRSVLTTIIRLLLGYCGGYLKENDTISPSDLEHERAEAAGTHGEHVQDRASERAQLAIQVESGSQRTTRSSPIDVAGNGRREDTTACMYTCCC